MNRLDALTISEMIKSMPDDIREILIKKLSGLCSDCGSRFNHKCTDCSKEICVSCVTGQRRKHIVTGDTIKVYLCEDCATCNKCGETAELIDCVNCENYICIRCVTKIRMKTGEGMHEEYYCGSCARCHVLHCENNWIRACKDCDRLICGDCTSQILGVVSLNEICRGCDVCEICKLNSGTSKCSHCDKIYCSSSSCGFRDEEKEILRCRDCMD